MKEHARPKGVRLIGDLPFFVSPDSSDVWANPELFLLDAQHRPRVVGGVPPDYFQRGGAAVGQSGLRLGGAAADAATGGGSTACGRCSRTSTLIRLDHFRGFAAAWHIPAASADGAGRPVGARPGAADFFGAVEKAVGGCRSSRRIWG